MVEAASWAQAGRSGCNRQACNRAVSEDLPGPLHAAADTLGPSGRQSSNHQLTKLRLPQNPSTHSASTVTVISSSRSRQGAQGRTTVLCLPCTVRPAVACPLQSHIAKGSERRLLCFTLRRCLSDNLGAGCSLCTLATRSGQDVCLAPVLSRTYAIQDAVLEA